MDGAYVQHILQKYRLSVALAVLRSKPQDISIENYIEILRNKIQISDPRETFTNISIDENDFCVSDDSSTNVSIDFNDSNGSVTILQNYDVTCLDNLTEDRNSISDVMETLKGMENNKQSEIMIPEKSTENITFNSDFDIISNTIRNNETFNNNNNNFINSDVNLQYTNINNGNIITKVKENIMNDHYSTDDKVNNLNIKNYSQETQIYSVHGFSDFNTHISQSQDLFAIDDNHIFGNKQNILKNNDERLETTDKYLNDNSKGTAEFPLHIRKKSKRIIYSDSVIQNIENIPDTDVTIHETDDSYNNNNNIEGKKLSLNNNSQLYLTSQDVDKKLDGKYDQSENLNAFDIECSLFSTNTPVLSANSNRTVELLDDAGNGISHPNGDMVNNSDSLYAMNDDTSYLCCYSNDQSFNKLDNCENEMETVKENEKIPDKVTDTDVSLKDFANEVDGDESNAVSFDSSKNKGQLMSDDSGVKILQDERRFNNGREGNVRRDAINDPMDLDSDQMEDLSESQAEVVPFKVMEELRKVKVYLSRRKCANESRGVDSGFRSNSRASIYSASNSCLWLNQSSHCLFAYLSECPLLVSTVEINEEIAKVLGSLVDQLHDDEVYPMFLEEILAFVEDLLKKIYEGSGDGDNIFLKNDERLDRMLLLNKSQCIMQYTIEKITNILEEFHECLQNGGHFELENIEKAENLCYILHLLEILLRKYNTNQSSQSSQCSQEAVLKRSTLTEMWRRKWNLSRTEVCQREEGAGRDVTAACCRALNKVVVKALDGYSLVAFAALQCFNLLQS